MSDEEGQAPEEAKPDGEASEGAVVFVDPELPDGEGLGSALGMPVRVVDPESLDLESIHQDDLGLVIAWDLGAQSALDVVEFLRLHDRFRELPIVVASSEPTRRRVLAALRVGATSFAFQPYDADELRTRLTPAEDATEA